LLMFAEVIHFNLHGGRGGSGGQRGSTSSS
jgi:hypothetical protein